MKFDNPLAAHVSWWDGFCRVCDLVGRILLCFAGLKGQLATLRVKTNTNFSDLPAQQFLLCKSIWLRMDFLKVAGRVERAGSFEGQGEQLRWWAAPASYSLLNPFSFIYHT
jgi:hypothetical protein